jgi:hypothetical protein
MVFLDLLGCAIMSSNAVEKALEGSATKQTMALHRRRVVVPSGSGASFHLTLPINTGERE